MTRSKEDICYEIDNTYVATVAAAYTVYEALKAGTNAKIVSKENFCAIFMNNASAFKTILEENYTETR